MDFIDVCMYWIVVSLILVRLSYQHFADPSQVNRSYVTPTEVIFFIGLILFGLIIPILSRVYLTQYNYQVAYPLKIVGLGLGLMTLFIFWKAHADLDRQFSPTLQIKKDHELVTTGIYGCVRHPMYFAGLLMILSGVSLLPNFVSMISLIITFLILWRLRIKNEEKMMLNEFGEKYQKYMEQTCGIIPWICHLFT